MSQLTSQKPETCPACKKKSTERMNEMTGTLGYIPLTQKSFLFFCRNCNLFFRWPYLSPEELEQHYSEIGTEEWKDDYRIDQKKISKLIKRRLSSGNVLDVGCFRGEFLNELPGNFIKYGIEPSLAARDIAHGHGIKLIGSTLDSIDTESVPTFDVITAIDLIEHVQNPLDALQQLANLLKAGGYLIVSTGNTDAFTWRLLRENYWYYFTEHVSFTNPKWFRWACEKLCLTVEATHKFAYYKGSFYLKLRQLAMAVGYRAWQFASQHGLLTKTVSRVWPFNRIQTWTTSPVARMWPDHMIIVLRKKLRL